MKERIKTLLLIILAFLVIGLWIFSFVKNGQVEDGKDLLELQKQEFSSFRNDKNQLVIKQKVIETSNKHLIDSLTGELRIKEKGLKSAVLYYTSTGFKKKKIQWQYDTIDRHDSFSFYKEVQQGSIKFHDSDAWHVTSGFVDSTGITFEKNVFIDSTLITEKRTGLFKQNLELKIVSVSPYTDVNKVKSVKIKPKKRIGLKIIGIASAFVLGIITEYKLTQ